MAKHLKRNLSVAVIAAWLAVAGTAVAASITATPDNLTLENGESDIVTVTVEPGASGAQTFTVDSGHANIGVDIDGQGAGPISWTWDGNAAREFAVTFTNNAAPDDTHVATFENSWDVGGKTLTMTMQTTTTTVPLLSGSAFVVASGFALGGMLVGFRLRGGDSIGGEE